RLQGDRIDRGPRAADAPTAAGEHRSPDRSPRLLLGQSRRAPRADSCEIARLAGARTLHTAPAGGNTCKAIRLAAEGLTGGAAETRRESRIHRVAAASRRAGR